MGSHTCCDPMLLMRLLMELMELMLDWPTLMTLLVGLTWKFVIESKSYMRLRDCEVSSWCAVSPLVLLVVEWACVPPVRIRCCEGGGGMELDIETITLLKKISTA